MPETSPLLRQEPEPTRSDMLGSRYVAEGNATHPTDDSEQLLIASTLEVLSNELVETTHTPTCGPIGIRGQYFAAITAAMSVFVTAQIFSWNIPLTMTEASNMEKILLMRLPKIASFFSPIPCSYIMDKQGRKTTLSYCILLAVVAWLILAFSTNVWLMMCARFLMGLWHGVEQITFPIYIAEVADSNSRALMISMATVIFNLGVLFSSLISMTSTVTMNLLCLIPPVFLFSGFLFIPESPYFFLIHNRRVDAGKSLLWLYGECRTEHLYRMETYVKEQLTYPVSFREIFMSSSNRKAFFFVECLKLCSATSVTMTLFPHYFSEVSLPNGWFNSYRQGSSNSYVSLAWVVFALIPPAIIFKFKFHKLMMVSALGTVCTHCFNLCLIDASPDSLYKEPVLPFMLLLSVVIYESIGITFIASVVQSEIFPINVKTKACALSCMSGFLFEFIGILFLSQMHLLLWIIYCVSGLAAAVVICFCLFETEGKSLEDIQDILCN